VEFLVQYADAQTPDILPILSRGKHRNPRRGACFMELASYLAGERWSDRPTCTHPLLASVARHVNDHTSDAGRARLAPLIPSVIGLTSDDPRVDARIALLCATTALPLVASERQRVMAISVLAAERALADLNGLTTAELSDQSQRALALVPDAAAWARQFTRGIRTSSHGFRRHGAPSTVRYAVEGIARACIPRPDDALRDLLGAAIEECAAAVHRDRPGAAIGVDSSSWAQACRLIGAAAR
jgi:hypothetical protein